MSARRIYGVLLQEFYLTIHSLEVIVDVFIFPIINIVVFGLISLYLTGEQQALAGQYVLLGMILWQVIWIISYSVAVGSMWNIWSRNLSNMFVAPLTMSEYIAAHAISGSLKALFLLSLGGAISAMVFELNILAIGFVTLVLACIVFAIFAFSIALAVLGLIFRYGTRIAALSWSVIIVFQPLSAAFFPLSIMPRALQTISLFFPPTYAFEAARFGLLGGGVEWRMMGIGFLIDLVYLCLSVILFSYLFEVSRDNGQFARNES
ncbi:ABC transporter permease [Candidatus Kaiserbacteria bacterium]|nr:ABC transporter permease [Candidatus Kaiserbacteria bacterium]